MIELQCRCAGEIAAVPNTYCAVGVAYGAKVSGIKLTNFLSLGCYESCAKIYILCFISHGLSYLLVKGETLALLVLQVKRNISFVMKSH